MKFVVWQRFKSNAICGEVNLPAQTECESNENVIYKDGKALCVVTSQNAHDYFARNDDGQGMKRGKLTQSIKVALRMHPEKWSKVWDDSLCKKYKRIEFADYWLWNHEFFNAPIEDLEYIAKLVSAGKEK